MMGSLARRERRPIWGALSFIFAAGIAFSVWTAFQTREQAVRDATSEARLAAQTELAPILQTRDLMEPVTAERATQLTSGIDQSITSAGPIQEVRIYSSLGRVLYAADPQLIGTRPSYLHDLTFEVANGEATSLVREGVLQTCVPIWLNPNSTVAVVEISQPVDPITSAATTGWYRIAMIAGALLLASMVLFVASKRTRERTTTSSTPVQVFQEQKPRRSTRDTSPASDSPLYQHAGFREIEEQRQKAVRRAEAAEQNFFGVQRQLTQALSQLKELEGRLVNQSQSSTNNGDLQALRDQLRETAERLNRAELDNKALRERMTLRQQELDEARRNVSELQAAGDVTELRTRLAEADARVAELARQVEKVEAELEYTNNKFHMTKLSEALREFDSDDIEIEEPDDDLYEHPVIIRNRSEQTTPQKVR